MADAGDLKSPVLWACGFESRFQHHNPSQPRRIFFMESPSCEKACEAGRPFRLRRLSRFPRACCGCGMSRRGQRPDPEEGTCPNMKKHPALNALPFLSALPGVVIGSHVMRLHQIPLSASLQNIGALLAGGLVSFLFLTLSAPRRARSGAMPAMPPCCCAPGRSAAPFWIQASGPFIAGSASGRWP